MKWFKCVKKTFNALLESSKLFHIKTACKKYLSRSFMTSEYNNIKNAFINNFIYLYSILAFDSTTILIYLYFFYNPTY